MHFVSLDGDASFTTCCLGKRRASRCCGRASEQFLALWDCKHGPLFRHLREGFYHVRDILADFKTAPEGRLVRYTSGPYKGSRRDARHADDFRYYRSTDERPMAYGHKWGVEEALHQHWASLGLVARYYDVADLEP